MDQQLGGGTRCDFCFGAPGDGGAALVRCGKCLLVHYCGMLSREASRRSHHRAECGAQAPLRATLASGLLGAGAVADAVVIILLADQCPRATVSLTTSHMHLQHLMRRAIRTAIMTPMTAATPPMMAALRRLRKPLVHQPCRSARKS